MTHVPVLVDEILTHFAPHAGDSLLDATVGQGGHARAYLNAGEDTRVTGIDADAAALEIAKQELAEFGSRVQLIHGTYANLAMLVGTNRFTHILFDLGVGSHQLADDARSFSFRSSGPLTMRYGHAQGLPPSDVPGVAWLERKLTSPPDVLELIRRLPEAELANLIWQYGQERLSRRIARAISQNAHAITSAQELAYVIAGAVPTTYERGRIHPATRTFQALRMAVNRELESLRMALPQAVTALVLGGKLAVISFHSLEDRLVKQYFKSDKRLAILTKKPMRAGQEERRHNPRARSAKLRIAEKLKDKKQTHDSKHQSTRYFPPRLASDVF